MTTAQHTPGPTFLLADENDIGIAVFTRPQLERVASGAFPSDAPTMVAEGTSASNEPNEQGAA